MMLSPQGAKSIFGNEILIENKSVKNKLELLGKDEKKKFGKKKEYKKDENLINIFDLIFKIGSINAFFPSQANKDVRNNIKCRFHPLSHILKELPG